MKPFLTLFILAVLGTTLLGCGSGTDAPTPTINAPAAAGPGGVPMLSADQLSKLPPDKQAQVQKDQAALQAAAAANMGRKDGRPGG